LRYTIFCIINDFEGEKLSGIPIRSGTRISSHQLKKIAKVLFEHGVNDLVVIHFPEGATFSPRMEPRSFSRPWNFPTTSLWDVRGPAIPFVRA